MSQTKKSKWRYIWVLPIVLLALSSIPKVFSMEFMVENMAESGMVISLPLLGAIELLCLILFVIPQTRKIGFLLTTAFLGGIIATEWITPPHNPMTGIVLQVLLWVGMYFESPGLFKIGSGQLETSA